MSQEVTKFVDEAKKFAENSQKFIRKCEKPDSKEFVKIATSCAIGFAIMGAIGYAIKLLFIPINNIILS